MCFFTLVLKTWASATDVECNDLRIRHLGSVNLSERFWKHAYITTVSHSWRKRTLSLYLSQQYTVIEAEKQTKKFNCDKPGE